VKLPTLFKRTSHGAIEQWRVWVENATIFTEHGQVEGKLQVFQDQIAEGKSIGKANATTAAEQALKETEARWRKKVERNGYVEDMAKAEAGITDQAGGIAPMLAKPHEDVATKLKYPCLVQRKYNGIRCIAVVEDTGEVTLWSRKRERIASVPHIASAIEAKRLNPGTVLDGELYVHGWSLQKIASFVRQKKKPKPGHEQVGYHIYDCPSDPRPNAQRCLSLIGINGDVVKGVPSYTASDEVAVWRLHDEFVREGYEGAIARNADAKYQPGRRSPDLQKFKRFDENEFEIVDSRLGRGKYAGIPILCCKTAEGEEFECNPPGTLEERAAVDREAVVGKMLTVKHFGWTDEKKPSFPVGVCIRDYE
jgi:DNA ligase-1